jgi:hypothetical protein
MTKVVAITKIFKFLGLIGILKRSNLFRSPEIDLRINLSGIMGYTEFHPYGT